MAILNLILLLLLPSLAWQAQAACTSGYASANYCLAQPTFDTLDNQGKDIKSSVYQITASNMQPVQAQATTEELAYWRQQADNNLQAGKNYWDGLSLIGANAVDGSPKAQMLNDPSQNYETVGLLNNFATIEAGLIQARDTYAYQTYRKYPDEATAKAKLLNTVKTLANLYIIVADEYLIDALDWRLPINMPGVTDPLLNHQIDLLNKAQYFYKGALNTFISGFSTSVNTNITISNYFDEETFNLFNLCVERMSLTLREKSSKQLAVGLGGNSTEVNNSVKTIKSANTEIYLTTAAAVVAQNKAYEAQQNEKLKFDSVGAGSALIVALNMLRNQGNIHNQDLNPLGFDIRYIPAQDFDDLYTLSLTHYNNAKDYDAQTSDGRSDFDSKLDKLQNQWNSLKNGYGLTLKSITGCNPYDPDFEECITIAGSDLFDCRIINGLSEMEACINNSPTRIKGGNLAIKYLRIKQAQLALNVANLTKKVLIDSRFDNLEKNSLTISYITQKGQQNKILLEKYLGLLKEARTIVDETVETTEKTKENGKVVSKQKIIDHTTRTSLTFGDALDVNVKKSVDLQALTDSFDIKNAQLQAAYAEKEFLRQIDLADLKVEQAVTEKNSAIIDFVNAFQEKESLVVAYRKSKEQSDIAQRSLVPLRIIKSAKLINLSAEIYKASHYAYLAAKAVEYRYAKSLTSNPNINDIYKAQTTDDVKKFLDALKGSNLCPWGKFSSKTIVYSLAFDHLNLTDDYIDPDGDGFKDGKMVDDYRDIKIQEFISRHTENGNLKFSLSVPPTSTVLQEGGAYNIKIWDGQLPSECTRSTLEPWGMTIKIYTDQIDLPFNPKVGINMTGSSSLEDFSGVFREYIPIYDYSHFLVDYEPSYVPILDDSIESFGSLGNIREQRLGRWTGKFHGRSISSATWTITVYGKNRLFSKTVDFSGIKDIYFYFDIIADSK